LARQKLVFGKIEALKGPKWSISLDFRFVVYVGRMGVQNGSKEFRVEDGKGDGEKRVVVWPGGGVA